MIMATNVRAVPVSPKIYRTSTDGGTGLVSPPAL